MTQPTNNPHAKSALRLSLRKKRRALNIDQQLIASQHLAEQLSKHTSFINAKHIALYLANDGEIDPKILLELAVIMGKECYLPALTEHGKLNFLLFRPGDSLTPNHLGINEPNTNSKQYPANQLDLVLMPLVGFDRLGRRLGMGGGFYDKTFAKLTSNASQKPTLIGLAHSCQEVERLQPEPWDIPLDIIVTDKELIRI